MTLNDKVMHLKNCNFCLLFLLIIIFYLIREKL